MNSSFLYHAWGLYQHNCLCEEYKANTIILHLQSKDSLKCCPKCGHAHWVKNGFHTRDFINLPIGGKKVILRMKVRSYKCKCANCVYDCQERISFALGSHRYTRRFARYVVNLLKGMALKDVAHLLGVSWDTIKAIHTHHLEFHYAPSSRFGKTGAREQSATVDENGRHDYAYRTSIPAWYDCPISTGKVEGIINKIKVMKRVAYGFRDERYFQLRLYALHDCRITPNTG